MGNGVYQIEWLCYTSYQIVNVYEEIKIHPLKKEIKKK